MKTLLIILGSLVGLTILFILYRVIKVRRHNKAVNAMRFERVRALFDRLKSGAGVTEADVLPFAKDLRTRETTFQLLAEHGQSTLFPQAYNTLLHGAAANLATWLEFPTELDAIPDGLEHLQRFTIDFDGHQNFVHYEVFRYRTLEPHWAAKDGWMLGVVGPYFDDSKPYDFPTATFSRFRSESESTPEQEARWVHENISGGH